MARTVKSTAPVQSNVTLSASATKSAIASALRHASVGASYAARISVNSEMKPEMPAWKTALAALADTGATFISSYTTGAEAKFCDALVERGAKVYKDNNAYNRSQAYTLILASGASVDIPALGALVVLAPYPLEHKPLRNVCAASHGARASKAGYNIVVLGAQALDTVEIESPLVAAYTPGARSEKSAQAKVARDTLVAQALAKTLSTGGASLTPEALLAAMHDAEATVQAQREQQRKAAQAAREEARANGGMKAARRAEREAMRSAGVPSTWNGTLAQFEALEKLAKAQGLPSLRVEYAPRKAQPTTSASGTKATGKAQSKSTKGAPKSLDTRAYEMHLKEMRSQSKSEADAFLARADSPMSAEEDAAWAQAFSEM